MDKGDNKMFQQKKRKKIWKVLFFVFAFAFILISTFYVSGYWTFGSVFRSSAGTYSQVYSSNGGLCLDVDNNLGTDVFVPANSYNELNSFLNYKPSGITVTSCTSNSKRVSEWCGKYNMYTSASTGLWVEYTAGCTFGDYHKLCRDTYGGEVAYYGASSFDNEYIYNWRDSDSTYYNWTKPTYTCKFCTEYYSSTHCANAGCEWHNYGWTCARYSCGNYGSGDCANRGCYWNYYCYDAPSCSYYHDQSTCPSAYTAQGNCGWDYYSYCCYPANDYIGCYQYSYDSYGCQYYVSGCQYDWNTNTCHRACE